MLHGPDAGEDRGVAGIRDGGQNSSDAGGMGAVLQNAAEMRDFQAVLIGFEDVVGAKAVDGDHEE